MAKSSRPAAATIPETSPSSAQFHQHDARLPTWKSERLLRDQQTRGNALRSRFHERRLPSASTAALLRLAENCRPCHSILATGPRPRSKDAFESPLYHSRWKSSLRPQEQHTRNPAAIEADEGVIDPGLQDLIFGMAIPTIGSHGVCYAVHPMSY